MRPLLLLLACCAAASAAAQSPDSAISNAEHLARRDALVARLPNDAVVIAFGERDEIGFPAFFQNPNFRYLTGLDEPKIIVDGVPVFGVTKPVQISPQGFRSIR